MSKIAGNRGVRVVLVLGAALASILLARFWLGLGLVALLITLIAYLCRPAGVAEVYEFTTRSELTTSPTSRRFIAHHLATGRRLRVVLVIAAIVLPNLIGAALGGANDRYPISGTSILWACMAGTLWAELSVTRPRGSARVASLVPRDPAAYLGRLLRWGPVAAAALTALVWAGVFWLPTGSGRASASGLDIGGGVALALIVPVVITGAQRWILRRPQPLVAPELVAADDAVRAASVRNLAAVGCAVVLFDLTGGLLQYIRAIDVSAVDWLFSAAIAASLGLALVSWWSRAWWRPVRRQPFPLAAEAAEVVA